VGLNFEQETKEANFRYSLVIAPDGVNPPPLIRPTLREPTSQA
jgi:hypothetical protein